MIVKGHDFPNVTLVGVLAADLSLSVGDYRAGERTFQLLTQAAGRAGRGTSPGEVVIQTYQPEHYAVVHAANQDYEAFYEEEILYRDLLQYPPVMNMLAVQIYAGVEDEGKKLAEKLAKSSERSGEKVQIIGPAPAGIGKIKDIYRFVFYIKAQNYDTLTRVKDYLEQTLQTMDLKQLHIQFDFNPMNTL